ncbi:hypothetical protein K7472_31785 [Streptomyces sp. PTM05]|uniref:WD40 repeat protein n=1 Tax=Streptantibioticus parmotrematis TaxID=2873249 RepID=A0ABS7R1P5_9ACTN|nr:hypothetical protein [Streptantibioticus parmotrematis]MBY8889390.1 hypothetical protein [Streptantibioticus parmotrematis]
MSARTRIRTTAVAIAVAAAVTGGVLLGTGSAEAKDASGTTAASHGTLTVSNGTKDVLIGGKWVDFGVVVRDLSWSPDGSKAAFVDGSGNLVVTGPTGAGRVVVAVNPGGQTWSHPTWQVSPAVPGDGLAAKDNLIFTASVKGVNRLETVTATAHHGTPEMLSLNSEFGEKALPQTGNQWPSAAGTAGTSVYANSTTGDVYVRDDNLRQMGAVLTAGSEPALSPNGDDVVFVRSVAGHDHIFSEDLDHSAVKDLTPRDTTVDYTEPAWSPDGTTLAVRTPSGTVTMPANGSGSPAKATSVTGLAAYRG